VKVSPLKNGHVAHILWLRLIVYCYVHLIDKTLSGGRWVQSINHERCDTMEFWENSTDKLAT